MIPGDAGDQLVQACSNCSALLDVSEYEPLSQVACPNCGAISRVERMFNQFTLLDVLGEGGMGTVFRALDTSLNRTVALKLLRKDFSGDAEYLEKLDTEAKITASINHPHVVKVYSFGSDHGQYYLAMELVDKGTLDDLIELQGRVAEIQTLEVGIQAASGLNAAHQRGLIHRDVKPGNILFAEAHTSKISDFGLAILAEREAEVRGEIWGTPYYVAPEKLNNLPEDHRSDMYSLGATLFHALAGRPPFEASTASMVALKHLKSQAVSLQAFAPDVTEETAYVINRMLSKDQNERYQTYEELIEHLRFAYDSLTTAVQTGSRREKQRVVIETQEQQTLVGWMTLILLVVVIGGAVSLFLFRDKLFGGSKTVKTEAVTPGHTMLAQAPAALARGDTSEIKEPLKEAVRVETDPKTKAILRLLLATAALNDGGESGMLYQVLSEAGPYSTDPKESALANTFVEVGNRLAKPSAIPPEEAESLPNSGPESIVLLVYGLKNWQLQQTTNSIPFFERFLAGSPGDAKWVSDLRPLAEACLSDAQKIFSAWKGLREATPGQRKIVLDGLKAVEKNPSAPGRLAEVTRLKIRDLAAPPKVAAAPTPTDVPITTATPDQSVAAATPEPSLTPATTATASATPTPAPTPTPAQPPVVKPLTAPWQHADVGTVQVPGNASFDNGVFTVYGAGSNIFNEHDEFHFIYQPMENECEIIARIASHTNVAPWGKAGIMIRENIAPGSKHVAYYHFSQGGMESAFRNTTDGKTGISKKKYDEPFPTWVKISRMGDVFTVSSSQDGVTWKKMGSATVQMTPQVLVGLVQCSHKVDKLADATFDNVTVNKLQPPWKNQDIGTVGTTGTTKTTETGLFTVNGGGTDVGGNADSFHMSYQPGEGDCSITARVVSETNPHEKSRAGVMIRETLTPDSPDAFVNVMPNGWVDMGARAEKGKATFGKSGKQGIKLPYWIRVTRVGNQFTGFVSPDGVTWTKIGETGAKMGQKVFLGVFVCSRRDGKLCTATFDNVTVVP